MTYEVILQPEVERAIQRQARWLVKQSNSPSIALRWVRSIRHKIATLKTHPLRCPIDPDSDVYGEETRVLLHGKRNAKFRIISSFAVMSSASSPSVIRRNGLWLRKWKTMAQSQPNRVLSSRILTVPAARDR